MNTVARMKEEIQSELASGEDLDQIKDRSGEIIDGYLPIYNNEIIAEWQNMPNEYDNRGSAELGHMGETSIVGLMSLDLYLYYTDLFGEAMQEVEQELEDAESEATE
jgi:hypothetical protein